MKKEKELVKHLYKNAQLIIMDKNDSRGTRDFLIADYDDNTFYSGSTHSSLVSAHYFNNVLIVSKKKELKRNRDNFIERGFIQKTI